MINNVNHFSHCTQLVDLYNRGAQLYNKTQFCLGKLKLKSEPFVHFSKDHEMGLKEKICCGKFVLTDVSSNIHNWFV